MSYDKYKKTLKSLIKIGKVTEMQTSHKLILNWVEVLESVIAEQ